jgi:ferredoxin-NADP reductase
MKLKLIDKKEEAKGTKSFFWEPEEAFTYLPGQYFYWTLPTLNYPDPKGNTRHITISSSPTEGHLLRFTTRIRPESGFKKTLDELPLESEIDGEGPDGEFILDETDKGPHIFIAGGIGITPFRSMIKYVADKDLDIPIHLIYSASTYEEAAFRNELAKLSETSTFFQMNIVVTSKTGRIDENLISQLTAQLVNPTYWLSGPPSFTKATKEVLEKLHVPSGRTRSEDFTGY